MRRIVTTAIGIVLLLSGAVLAVLLVVAVVSHSGWFHGKLPPDREAGLDRHQMRGTQLDRGPLFIELVSAMREPIRDEPDSESSTGNEGEP